MKQFNTSILKVRGNDGQFKELPAIAGTVADDSKISRETTWSSDKLVSRFASKPQKIADALYLVEYSGLNPDAAEDYFTKFHPTIGGACSSMHNGNFYGRNYDWSRNHQAVFVVHVPSIGAKHASYGMAAMTSLTTDVADTGVYDNRYEILPFITLDGINDAGVVCNTNVVPPNDRGATTGSNPGAPSLCALAVPRFILDNASSAAEAVEMLRARNIYSARYDGLEEEYHFMIGDAENTYIVEFNNNEMVVVEDQHIMTNFFNYGFDGNTATAFYKSEDFDEATTTLTAHPMGLERYDILAAAYDTATSVDAMHDAMKSVWYTKTYDADAETPWYSEYCYDYGAESTYGDLDISRPAEDYEGIYNLLCERFAAETRDTAGFWETVHSSVYDIEKRQLNVWVKEEDTKHTFSVEKLGQDMSAPRDSIVFTLKSTANSDKSMSEYEFIECTHTQDEIVDLYRNADSSNEPRCFVKVINSTMEDYRELYTANIACYSTGSNGAASINIFAERVVPATNGSMSMTITTWNLFATKSDDSWGSYTLTTSFNHALDGAVHFYINPTSASKPVSSSWKPLRLLDIIPFVRQTHGGAPYIPIAYATHDSENSLYILHGELVITSTSFRIEAYHAGELLGWITIDENNAWVWNVPEPNAAD